jgi:hypothetical protein
LRIYLELGRRRCFAVALDWPGWARRGTSEEDAIETLLDYRDRYAKVAERAGAILPSESTPIDVVERVPFEAGASFVAPDFGALGTAPGIDADAVWDHAEADRQVALMRAAWSELADVVHAAPPDLRKGPRGGGRDRDGVVDHVLGAEVTYARKLGVRHPQSSIADPAKVAAWRVELEAALRLWRGDPAPSGWSGPYAARRIIWHVLDHAWEIEDRSA